MTADVKSGPVGSAEKAVVSGIEGSGKFPFPRSPGIIYIIYLVILKVKDVREYQGGDMARNNEPEGAMNTIIGKGTKIEGTMDVQQSLRIDGSFKGSLNTSDTLIVGSTGELLDVTIKAKNAIIGGIVKGTVTAVSKVTLESTSKLEGDLTAKLLIIEEGALFTGNCKSGDGTGVLQPREQKPQPK